MWAAATDAPQFLLEITPQPVVVSVSSLNNSNTTGCMPAQKTPAFRRGCDCKRRFRPPPSPKGEADLGRAVAVMAQTEKGKKFFLRFHTEELE